MSKKDTKPVLTGRLHEHSTWEFHISEELPDDIITTVSVGAVFHPDGVILTRNKRGWELPGGHIEIGETPEEALIREVHEEGGVKIDNHFLFGYRVLDNKKPGINKAIGERYPSIAHIPHYISFTKDSPMKIDCEDCFESKICSLDNDEVINSKDYDIILLAHNIYNSTQ